MAHRAGGSPSLAAKAVRRKSRVSIFGGSQNKRIGGRSQAGVLFNRSGTPFQRARQKERDLLNVVTPAVSVPGVDFDDGED